MHPPNELKTADRPKSIRQLYEIRDEIFSEDLKHLAALHTKIALACEIGEKLARNVLLWSEFVNADWKGQKPPKRKQQADAIRQVFRFIFGRSPRGRKNASFYYRAVTVLLRSGYRGRALSHELNRPGGLKALAAEAAKMRRDMDRANAVRKSGMAFSFAPQKVRNKWQMTMVVEFDREPKALMGLAGDCHPYFTLTGNIQKLTGPNRLDVLGFSFSFQDGNEPA
jgi:hypothetical protein